MNPDHPNWFSSVQAPQRIGSSREIDWDHEVDFLVAGFGGAGVSAALRAVERGLETMVIDKSSGGGATLASGGVLYAGGGTSVQASVGEVDTPDNMFNYLRLETGDIVSEETLRRFCENSAGDLDWLMSHGVQFSGPVWKQKTSYPDVAYFLYHSDNSLLPEYQEHARPAARGHRGVIRKGRSAVDLGGSIFNPLRRACQSLGVGIHTETSVEQLIFSTDEQKVVGVRAWRFPHKSPARKKASRYRRLARVVRWVYPFFLPGASYVHRLADRMNQMVADLEATHREAVTYRARVGVCISAGGFIFNRQMVEYYCPEFLEGMPLGTPADDGSGIRLGQSVGGVVAHMNRATAWRFVNPPLSWARGIIVNSRGARFVNEMTYGATIGEALVRKAGGRATLLLDSDLVRSAWREIRPTRVLPFQWQLGMLNMLFGMKKFADLPTICRQLGFEQNTLSATLAQVRAVAEGSISEPFGKPDSDVPALNFPLYAIDVSLDTKLLPCAVLTMGGLRVNENTGEVLGEQGEPVGGLYAAGRSAVGIPSNLYMSGLSIADCVFSGLRAADHAASLIKEGTT